MSTRLKMGRGKLKPGWKNCTATCWKYQNHPVRGTTWALELRVGNAIFCTFGQNLRACVAVANKAMSRLKWNLIEDAMVVDPPRNNPASNG